MSEKEKATWNAKTLTRSTGIVMIVSAFLLFISIPLTYFDLVWLFLILVAVFVVGLVLWIWHVNKHPKFRQ
jgi:flagellar biosynthesis component FlhA